MLLLFYDAPAKWPVAAGEAVFCPLPPKNLSLFFCTAGTDPAKI